MFVMEVIVSGSIELRRRSRTRPWAVRTLLTLLTHPRTEAIQNAIAFHHAGLELSDRRLVEEMFRNEDILVLAATTTMALGVNFPCHLVVVKGTDRWQKGQGFEQYNINDVQQMIGTRRSNPTCLPFPQVERVALSSTIQVLP